MSVQTLPEPMLAETTLSEPTLPGKTQWRKSSPCDEDLVAAARAGDEAAWEQIVLRYSSLVNRICWRYRMDANDAADIAQQVWIRLIEYIDRLRTPAALPGWIATTASRACLAVANQRQKQVSTDLSDEWAFDRQQPIGCGNVGPDDVSDGLLRAERCRAVQLGLAELSSRQRELLLLLVAEPPLPYQQISERTGMPVGSIGPTRARLLKRLGESAALRPLTEPTDTAVARVA